MSEHSPVTNIYSESYRRLSDQIVASITRHNGSFNDAIDALTAIGIHPGVGKSVLTRISVEGRSPASSDTADAIDPEIDELARITIERRRAMDKLGAHIIERLT